uniref:non-specific serine/threonine protein kinase n=1 Tax=Panagrolaimus davidi TaxID=227884 RepID=A0A914QYB4_9BILA
MVRYKIYDEFESEGKIILKTRLSEVREFRDLHTGEKVIGKIEHVKAFHPKLREEYDIYMSMGFESGIPRIYHFGIHDNFNILIMEHLGTSLAALLKECGGKFNVKTVTNIAIQLIDRMEYIHDHGIIHKDIKPLNFVMGTRENAQTVYIIDFNCSSKFIDPKTKKHIPDEYKPPLFQVNSCYNSLKVHVGSAKSRRDDLEAISYILIYFLRGNLPWQHCKNTDEIDEIYEMKRSISVEELCEGLPTEFGKHLSYCRELKFKERPDYGYVRKCFESLKKTLDDGPDFEWL